MPTKSFDETTGRCRVEFRLPADQADGHAWLAGEFNGWSTDACPLERQDDGSLAVTVLLDAGTSHRFRYYLGDGRWTNDPAADGYVDNDHGGADSIVTIPNPTSEASDAGSVGDGPGPQVARETVEREQGGPPDPG